MFHDSIGWPCGVDHRKREKQGRIGSAPVPRGVLRFCFLLIANNHSMHISAAVTVEENSCSCFLRASKALRKPLTTSGWTRPQLPSGYGRSVQKCPTRLPKGRRGKSQEANASAHQSHEANASAQRSPEKSKGKLTSKLTFLGVFQTYRPTASKRTNGPVDCELLH
uniref:Transmembrane protein n=1 Tax=Heterorhabditis bacteriophora TaxID=37862 RepID=A0A1I7XB33_HETBA